MTKAWRMRAVRVSTAALIVPAKCRYNQTSASVRLGGRTSKTRLFSLVLFLLKSGVINVLFAQSNVY